MRYLPAVATLIFLPSSLPVYAQNRQLISSRCRGDRCWELYLLNKKAVRQDQWRGSPRTVYEILLENKTPRGTEKRQDWVQCSTKEPFVAITNREWNPGIISIRYINPGGATSNATVPDHRTYWAVCHNVLQADAAQIAKKAKSLGYSLQLREYSQEVPQQSFDP